MAQVLPLPHRLTNQGGLRSVPGSFVLDGPGGERVAQLVRQLFPDCTPAVEGELRIRWREAPEHPSLADDETYALVCTEDAIRIDAASVWGALWGVQTLAQLGGNGDLPLVEIDDGPRFPWRGLMLDPARRFLPAETIHAVIDGMARLKLNVLHLHLSDDQGFRFPSRAFPKLASADHYTEDELKDIVSRAAALGIRVVPELDMPGHVTSWLTAYPEWGIKPVQPTERFGVHEACLDPTKEALYEAVGKLLAEVSEIFPDQYVHVGGDEVHPAWWREAPHVQRFMEDRGFADGRALQNHFLSRVGALAEALGKKCIGWDEVVHADMPRDVTVQNWRGATYRDHALGAGADCIVSAPFYLDLFYPADVHYGFDPEAPVAELLALEDAMLEDPRFAHVADGMRWTHAWRKGTAPRQAAKRGNLLGAEACLWSELVDADTLPVRLWSRLPALAERFWSDAQVTDLTSLYERWPDWCRQASAVADERLALCEPVRWYARLLGEVALRARLDGEEMPQARPYRTTTELSRPIDFLPPESLAARAVLTMDDDVLAESCERWLALLEQPCDEELEGVYAALAEGCRHALAVLRDEEDRKSAKRALADLHRPYGEYLPALCLSLSVRL